MSFDATETNSSPYGVHLHQIMQVGEAQNVTLQAQFVAEHHEPQMRRFVKPVGDAEPGAI